MSHQNAGENGFGALANAWSTATRSVLRSATAANRAAVAAMGSTESSDDYSDASVPSLEFADPDWTFERSVEDPTALAPGDNVTFEKELSDEDVRAFAEISGDTNRLHLDEEFAADTRFGGRIVHGTLVSGLISAALARLPGLTIYLSQDLEFAGPVGIGDRVSARVEIVEDLGNAQYRLETVVRDENNDTTVVDGEAVVLIDDLPEA
ncbi:MaoC family dehydratase [Natronococcus occultus]|uniref:Acyl dehydratase n=1 Tax=Natronococcus occultus SP4 TaxID=694430 RepID=L0JYJ6_9EURY|nr:MaoC family dehydratase [Natronococcus occultus]AGB37189.1 acyl dehydratase [Natronococcus occultus SP4]